MRRDVAMIVAVLSAALLPSAGADDPFNYAAMWRSWDGTARAAYMQGVVDATAATYLEASSWLQDGELFRKPESMRVQKVREKMFLRELSNQIPAVVTDLYKDPANAFVGVLEMVYAARDKLEGKNIEASLAQARKRALDNHRLSEEQRSK